MFQHWNYLRGNWKFLKQKSWAYFKYFVIHECRNWIVKWSSLLEWERLKKIKLIIQSNAAINKVLRGKLAGSWTRKTFLS